MGERDTRGVSLLHWAAGSGNLDAFRVLEQIMSMHSNYQKGGFTYSGDGDTNEHNDICRVERDGATPLHWAAAGAGAKEFGIGGHFHMCSYIIERAHENSNKRNVVNANTKDGNSILMWASWAGSLEIVQLLISNDADIHQSNRNGCTVAHW